MKNVSFWNFCRYICDGRLEMGRERNEIVLNYWKIGWFEFSRTPLQGDSSYSLCSKKQFQNSSYNP
jgi:hypothetical protein